ncbi:3-deoxy-7-phosphoheptulonate synthase [Pseudohaliea rubra]|uniref:Phospho-2-dehydro-3-deoxyheptonate aldolase n=1 Tax=Pseudohaliea rubra DSM 19751 TaxID=1265313 RepID=A0A095WY52_9GAMM|nr:3-deoxy-7-phosphoheptulonate synthase [Pseudohaliea rubra]KGE03554.1 2-keto-3-deoxy-D-arabino-heptulosonate-7- phosphate synthase I alpha [Pseudohaliea rubra DSM 19751]
MSERELKQSVHNVNVAGQKVLIPPAALKAELPLGETALGTLTRSRQVIEDILDGRDPRLFVVVGPCSIHDPEAARDYARRLKALADEVSDTLFIVMRAYFEKPRTTVGWKGLINDPYMDDTFRIEDGLRLGRRLLLDLLELGLPTATEALDPISPQYLQDLIAWSAIGARTTESQTHREMASGLSSAVGFKNGTDGSLTVATNALKSAARPHRFLGINHEGRVAVYTTRGNRYGHIVLRGGSQGPNYDSVHVKLAETALAEAGLSTNIMVDCSHANSNKRPELQPLVVENVVNQILEGNASIVGLMIESHLEAGSQPLAPPAELAYGVSVTDGCIGWSETEQCLREARAALRGRLPGRRRGAAAPATDQ